MNKRVLVTGSNGQLGQELRALEKKYNQFDFLFTTKDELSIQDHFLLKKFFKKHNPSFCINCAAYTAVDKAETEKDLATRINGDGPGFLAEACDEVGTKFIHISTDYVFDGASPIPYKETDETNPVNHYGMSKLIGEKRVMESIADAVIIRTAWVYSEYGNNFVKTMMRLMNERENLNVVSDQHGSPTYAADLAEVILKIISKEKIIPGIYHYSNEGSISWYEFAEAIKEMTGSNCRINPIPTTQYPTPAKRPAFSLLDKTKIKSTFDLEIPDWKTSLKKCIVRLRK
ncbi:MAG TPA: dTDP-4-dehydrorhamnose reductase [Chitinophagaceae bacterium]|nr:dTDP-4-dehydrorhamnose reductase [Chitinophagaceae bacterium]